MIPIPKAKFFDRKVPSGVDRQVFEDEIIKKQAHVLQGAISRVSSTHGKIYGEILNHDSGDSLIFFLRKDFIFWVTTNEMDLEKIFEIFRLSSTDFRNPGV